MNNFLFSCHGSSWIIVKGVGYTISISMCAHICILCIYTTGKVYFYMWNILMPSTYSISPIETLCITRRTLTRTTRIFVYVYVCVFVCVCIRRRGTMIWQRGSRDIVSRQSSARRRYSLWKTTGPLHQRVHHLFIRLYEYNKEPKNVFSSSSSSPLHIRTIMLAHCSIYISEI